MLQHGEIGREARRQAPARALGERHPGAAGGERGQRLGPREPLTLADHHTGAHVTAGDDRGEGHPRIGRLVVGGDPERNAKARQAPVRQELAGGAAQPRDLVAGRAIEIGDRVRRGHGPEPTDACELRGRGRVEVHEHPAQLADGMAGGDVLPHVEHFGQAARDERVHP